jgi:ribosomal protein L40E
MAVTCAKCGSDKVVPNAKIFDQGEYSDGTLKAAFEQNPSAWFFKGRVLSNLRAKICGECGFTELYAESPRAIYEAFEPSTEEGMADDGASRSCRQRLRELNEKKETVPDGSFMELYPEHPRAIYEGFEPSKQTEGTPDDICLQCGAQMPEEHSVCASCGWTYQGHESA